ncbi:hypothetical protein [Pectobacterium aquaticum]|uniref:hypothetical protein n=1 Tax=Pectobacterium aquaticum TaxID=2204145 RepID=UPI000E28264F|nr:hypothetical protein [Pectobacterium aquaticum]RRO02584.1 hypothetical protein DMB83_008740 [Pectobacterium aquaticum]
MNKNIDHVPTLTLPLILIENSNGYSSQTRERKKIDISGFPEEIGAYVIRYQQHPIPRLIGTSPILKIGCTTDSFRKRFNNYNHQSDMTIPDVDLYEKLKLRTQKTNIRIMYFLSHHKHQDEIVIDFYFSTLDEPKSLEYKLIKNYMESHGELPPLNFGMK